MRFVEPDWLATATQLVPEPRRSIEPAIAVGYANTDEDQGSVRHLQRWVNGLLISWERVSEFPVDTALLVRRPLWVEYECFMGSARPWLLLPAIEIGQRIGDPAQPISLLPIADLLGEVVGPPGSDVLAEVQLEGPHFGGAAVRLRLENDTLTEAEICAATTTWELADVSICCSEIDALQYLAGLMPMNAMNPLPRLEGDPWMAALLAGLFQTDRLRSRIGHRCTWLAAFTRVLAIHQRCAMDEWRARLSELTDPP